MKENEEGGGAMAAITTHEPDVSPGLRGACSWIGRTPTLDMALTTRGKIGGSNPIPKTRWEIDLSHTRPDLAYAAEVVSRFMHKPQDQHLKVVYRILRLGRR
uniref:Uncharacterized protein n=1 Tax=Chenopodium quinoa TaxID=63459 RepID=A0A803MVP8_CHEQI